MYKKNKKINISIWIILNLLPFKKTTKPPMIINSIFRLRAKVPKIYEKGAMANIIDKIFFLDTQLN